MPANGGGGRLGETEGSKGLWDCVCVCLCVCVCVCACMCVCVYTCTCVDVGESEGQSEICTALLNRVA